MTTSQQQFITNIATAAKKYAGNYGIKVVSPIIAQAILESAWGQSELGKKYHNYFGLKCGSAWKGKSVNMKTKEEYKVGTLTTISDNFRVYDSLDAGVKGYFEFINTKRYANLKGVTNPQTYLERIKADGYATSSSYVTNLMRVINTYALTRYDNVNNVATSSKNIEQVAREVIAGKYGSGNARKQKLEAEGYNYTEVQNKVNQLLSGGTSNKKSVEQVAREVIAGSYGVGAARRQKLEAEGYNYAEVQAKVNQLLRK